MLYQGITLHWLFWILNRVAKKNQTLLQLIQCPQQLYTAFLAHFTQSHFLNFQVRKSTITSIVHGKVDTRKYPYKLHQCFSMGGYYQFHNFVFKIFIFFIKIDLNIFSMKGNTFIKCIKKYYFIVWSCDFPKHYCNMFRCTKQFARLQALMTLEYPGYSS